LRLSLNSRKRIFDSDEIRGTGRLRRGDRERHRELVESSKKHQHNDRLRSRLVEVASIIVDAPYLIEWLKVSGLGQRLMDGAGEHRLDECGAQRTAIPPR
jgi:hypothetical protein